MFFFIMWLLWLSRVLTPAAVSCAGFTFSLNWTSTPCWSILVLLSEKYYDAGYRSSNLLLRKDQHGDGQNTRAQFSQPKIQKQAGKPCVRVSFLQWHIYPVLVFTSMRTKQKLKANNLFCKYFLVLVCQYVKKTINFAKTSQVALSESGEHYTFCLYPIKPDKET